MRTWSYAPCSRTTGGAAGSPQHQSRSVVRSTSTNSARSGARRSSAAVGASTRGVGSGSVMVGRSCAPGVAQRIATAPEVLTMLLPASGQQTVRPPEPCVDLADALLADRPVEDPD